MSFIHGVPLTSIIRLFCPRADLSLQMSQGCGFTRHWIRPELMEFFQSVTILNMTSFGREVKPLVPWS